VRPNAAESRGREARGFRPVARSTDVKETQRSAYLAPDAIRGRVVQSTDAAVAMLWTALPHDWPTNWSPLRDLNSRPTHYEGVGEGGERRGIRGSGPAVGQSVGHSAAELAEAILEVFERGGKHAWVEVVELCARTKRGASPIVQDGARLGPRRGRLSR
jgi:hypothetical protein